MSDMSEIKSLIDNQGQAFEAFKATLEELKSGDAVTAEKLARIEADLDRQVEAKAALEARIAAEAREREELELRLKRAGDPAVADETKAAGDLNLHAEAWGRKSRISADGMKDYRTGLETYLRKGEKLLTGEEVKAMSVGGDPDGGYLVTPDMSGRIVTKVYETSPMRQIANVTTIGTDSLEGIEDLDEAAAGWVGETDARTDTATPQIGKWKLEAFEMYAMPKVTQKLLDDASVDVGAWLETKIADKFARVENAAFVNGTGAGRPRGLTQYTMAADDGSGVSWGSVGFTVSGANGAITAADKIFDLVGLVKDAYLGASRFVTRRQVITALRKMKDSQGQFLWQPSLVAGNPETLAGYPITRAEDIPALATGSLSLWFGDFGTAYQIVDRIGTRVLRDPYSAKPYVIFYATRRTGGGLVNFEAVKAMKFSAS